jgi:hypothetical protein
MMDDADLLAAWETALARAQPLRGAALLALAEPGADERTLAALPLGESARRLLGLHAGWFGRRLACACECPACGEAVEADCDAAALRDAAPAVDRAPEPITLAEHGWTARFRVPCPMDLAHAARAGDAAAARRVLLERCVLEAQRDGAPCAAAGLSEEATIAIAAAMEHADPLAEIGLALQCPSCGAAWTATLEPERFVLAALEGAAREVMQDVHVLACAYGWTEAETLALGRARRRAYIEFATT